MPSSSYKSEGRIVTPTQYSQGWMLFVGGYRIRQDYRLIRRLPGGNYLVHEPDPEEVATRVI